MNKDLLQLQCFITGLSTRVDGSIGIRISTQEVNDETKLKLFKLLNKFGWFIFQEGDSLISIEDIPKYETDKYDTIKSPATRMRSVLYRLYEKDKLGYVDFDAYYRSRMEKIILQLKEKLPKLHE